MQQLGILEPIAGNIDPDTLTHEQALGALKILQRQLRERKPAKRARGEDEEVVEGTEVRKKERVRFADEMISSGRR